MLFDLIEVFPMIIEFSVANYLSYKERVFFSMVASNDDSLQENNVFEVGNINLLKSAAIYGANASGKTKLFDAISLMKRMVLSSSKDTQANEEIDVEEFKLSSECDGKPSLFEMVFFHNNMKYRYGFEVDTKKVHSEWLFCTQNKKELEFFTRDGQNFSIKQKHFKEGIDLLTKTRENALFLSACAQWNGEISKSILSWFRLIRVVHAGTIPSLAVTVSSMDDLDEKRRIMELTRFADPHIEYLEGKKTKWTVDDLPEEMPNEVKNAIIKDAPLNIEIKTTHKKYGKNNEEIDTVIFDLEENESSGTQKFLALIGPILRTIKAGGIFIIDELNARLHPLLAESIISLFNSSINKRNAQLIFTSHDTNLLSNKIFRRDQIWFTEKNQYGVSDLYSLAELQGIRKESLFNKDYILGKYGAIPFISDPKSLFCETNDE
jgi:uncharacterized protein